MQSTSIPQFNGIEKKNLKFILGLNQTQQAALFSRASVVDLAYIADLIDRYQQYIIAITNNPTDEFEEEANQIIKKIMEM